MISIDGSANTISGQLAQMVTSATGTVATGTTLMLADNSVPQNTAGDQYLSLAITPKSATSTLEIDISMVLSSSVANNLIVALFQDAAANALAANITYQGTATGNVVVTLKHIVTAGTTSATTFKVRAGGNNAGTTTFNGVGGLQKLGGVSSSRITIKEYSP